MTFSSGAFLFTFFCDSLLFFVIYCYAKFAQAAWINEINILIVFEHRSSHCFNKKIYIFKYITLIVLKIQMREQSHKYLWWQLSITSGLGAGSTRYIAANVDDWIPVLLTVIKSLFSLSTLWFLYQYHYPWRNKLDEEVFQTWNESTGSESWTIWRNNTKKKKVNHTLFPSVGTKSLRHCCLCFHLEILHNAGWRNIFIAGLFLPAFFFVLDLKYDSDCLHPLEAGD